VSVSTPALDNRHANRTFLCRIILSSVFCLTLPYFQTLSHKRTDFRGKKILLTLKSVFCLKNFSTQEELSEILSMFTGLRGAGSDWPRTGRSADRIPVSARFSAPIQTGPGNHRASCTLGTGSFPGVKSGRGMLLTPHPLLVPWSRKSRAIPILPL